MKNIAVICARGGSKGVPGKNTRLLAGKPLIAWTIGQALESCEFDEISVSSDSDEILDVARDAGATQLVKRPSALATDEASVHPSIVHCVAAVEEKLHSQFEKIILLQPTSPFRSATDISAAIALSKNTGATSIVSATISKNSPYFSIIEEDQNGRMNISKARETDVARRQDAPRCYDLNGSIYVFERDRYLHDPKAIYPDTRMFEMPEERSLDIDTEYDWEIAQALVSLRAKNE